MLGFATIRTTLVVLGAGFVVGALVMLDALGGLAYTATVMSAAILIALVGAALACRARIGLRWLRGEKR